MTSTPLPSGSSEFVCPSDGFFRDPNNCKVYFHCSNGQAYKSVCNSGLVFDSEMNVCNWADQVSDCPSESSETGGLGRWTWAVSVHG